MAMLYNRFFSLLMLFLGVLTFMGVVLLMYSRMQTLQLQSENEYSATGFSKLSPYDTEKSNTSPLAMYNASMSRGGEFNAAFRNRAGAAISLNAKETRIFQDAPTPEGSCGNVTFNQTEVAAGDVFQIHARCNITGDEYAVNVRISYLARIGLMTVKQVESGALRGKVGESTPSTPGPTVMLIPMPAAAGAYSTTTLTAVDAGSCIRMPDEAAQDSCLEKTALSLKDLNLCAKLRKPGTMDWCYYGIAAAVGNASICGEVSDLLLRDMCFWNASATAKNTTLCDKIQEPLYRNLCNGTSSLHVAAGECDAQCLADRYLFKGEECYSAADYQCSIDFLKAARDMYLLSGSGGNASKCSKLISFIEGNNAF
jgi:hypothetical protein